MNKSNTPLVSVVVITYNSSRHILETLESVKAQTWKDIQLVISDDASRDDTVQVCSEWIKENKSRFLETKIITVEKNTGTSANCTRGFRETTGEWVKLIAGDDVLLDNCIADNLEYVERFPEACFVISDVQEIDENSLFIETNKKNEALIFITDKKSKKDQLKAYSRWPEFLNTPTFFYKKELIDIIGYYDEEFKIYEDMAMVFKIIEAEIKMHYLRKPTVKYRVHPNSTSRSKLIDEIREKEALKIFKKYRKKNLCLFNPLDLSVYYESWLRFKYKGFFGIKGDSILRKFSLFYWYLKFNGVKNY